MYFTRTSDEPYTRHNYQLIFQNGKKLYFQHWEDAQSYWFDYKNKKELKFFEVLDPKPTPPPKKQKNSKSKGF